MNKKQIRLTESDLKQIIKESVNKILLEYEDVYDNAGSILSIDLGELNSAVGELQSAIEKLPHSGFKHIGRYKNALSKKVKEIYNIIGLMSGKNYMLGAYENEVDNGEAY